MQKHAPRWCKSCLKEREATYYKANRDRVLKDKRRRRIERGDEYLEVRKQQYRNLRNDTLMRYGGKCACCGLDRLEFLAFDHVNNDGNMHRLKVNSRGIIQWIRRNDYPDTIQVLCHNCNYGKHIYGVCPHKERP